MCQNGEARPINDYSEMEANAASDTMESVNPGGVYRVAGLIKLIRSSIKPEGLDVEVKVPGGAAFAGEVVE